MPSLDDLSDEEIMQYLKSRKGKKRYRVREFEIDGEDFARMFGLGEASSSSSPAASGEEGQSDEEEEGGTPKRSSRRLRDISGTAGDKFFGTGS